MKILFVAVFKPNSTNVAQARGFMENGHEVIKYDYREIAGRVGTHGRDRQLIGLCKKEKPDVTIFSKCNQMHYSVVDECNKIGKTVFWYMDATNNFDIELQEKIKRSTVALFGLGLIAEMSLKLNKNSYFLDQCPDDKMNFMLNEFEYKYDTTFIGQISGVNVHSDREHYKEVIGFNHFDNVHGLEHNNIVNQSKINLNFSHTDGAGTSVRVYKILAAGGFLLTTPWKENSMNQSFTVGKDFDIFTNENELRNKIDYYLNNEEKRNEIRLHGHQTVQQYLPKNWAKKIIEIVEQV